MKMKIMSHLAILVATAILFTAAIPLQASTDGRIKSSAKKSYIFKTYLKGDKIKIQSKDGVVTLTGTVSEESHKLMAEETMMSLPGVKSVTNQLIVTGEPASASSDAWLAQKVRSTLLFHRSVSYPNTNVSVTDGKVTLRGTASSEAQKQLTTEYARDISGVKEVDNQMIVKIQPPAKSRATRAQVIDDASITSQVRMSLKYRHGPDGAHTKVSTHKGVVTLAGVAKNQAEIDLATKRVSDIYGVKSVDNKMTIEATQSSSN